MEGKDKVIDRTISMEEEDHLQRIKKKVMPRGCNVSWVGWVPPLGNIVKLNTDDSILQAFGHTAVGGLLRNARGDWIADFSINVGISSVIVAELWGVIEGLRLARRRGLYGIELEYDKMRVSSSTRQPREEGDGTQR
ncbi:Ribonuclease H domain [Dillenia turbinata]|uniref:Ribonuclease H domain n=1 Tax=Dillenia turbinata TaxID=194707 RepID=A0AAN8VWN8_9MAGN